MKRINNCPRCRCEIWLPDELHDAAIKSAQIQFYCAYGHVQHFTQEGINAYWAKIEAQKQKVAIPIIQHDTTNVVPFRRQ